MTVVYLGDSAPLSGLQLLRAIVENGFGQCDFTTDPSRHKIMENIVELSSNNELPGVFPSLAASNALLESFFTNVRGYAPDTNVCPLTYAIRHTASSTYSTAQTLRERLWRA